jgi:ABC-2 type transport system permease protein
MSSVSYALEDSATMLRRNLRHALRYPSMTIATIGGPVLILLLFNYAFGGALGSGIGGAGGDGGRYIDYLAPGIILMAATSGSIATAVAVCTDMTGGIINRFRTMAISRSSVLTGHVVGSTIQTLISIVFVIAVALALGFRPTAGAGDWFAAAGLLALLTFALTWLSAAFGLVTKTPEAASNAPMPLQFLPLLGSAIVPTDSMPGALRVFAEHQPFTPIIETLRGLLMGTAIGDSAMLAIAWCAGLAIAGYAWARWAFHRPRPRLA